jgi:predicted phage terminase large subunit-like protein
MISAQDAYLKNVQATYRYYCYHVFNEGRDVEKDGYVWNPSKFHTYLCDIAQEFLEKQTRLAYEILIITTPPQHGKSTTITETLPSWYLLKNPNNSVIEISYGDDLAEKFGRGNLNKVKRFGSIFGVTLDKKKAKAREFRFEGYKGGMISKGLGSGITGNPADLILMDDPIKNREEADSETRRNAIWSEFFDTVQSRLSAGGKVILIMTRWHEDDLAGRILKEFPDRTTLVNLPCEAEENDPLGRNIGDALCSEIGKDNVWLADFKKAYSSEEGVRSWNALYQGRPTAREGNMIRREWWEFYDSSDYENGNLKFDNMIMSVDATFKDQKKNDFVAIEVWGKRENRYYLVDVINEHLDFPNTLRKILLVKAKYLNITAILIEDKANGTGIIQVLREEITGIISVEPDVSKEARVNRVSFIIEAHCCYLPRDKKFTWEFIEQCSAFPNGKHDDLVDSMSQALIRLSRSKSMRQIIRKMRRGDKYFTLPDKKTGTKALGKGEKINVI